MSHRFPPILPADPSPIQRTAEDFLTDIFGSNTVFKLKDDKGAFIGPYAVLMYVVLFWFLDVLPLYLLF